MSDNSNSAGGGLGLHFIVGTAVAWFNTASFTGWVGFGKSMLVGAGTSIGGTILAIPGAIGGALLGALVGGKKGALVGAFTCAIASSVVGGVQGYQFAHKALTEQTVCSETVCKTASAPPAFKG